MENRSDAVNANLLTGTPNELRKQRLADARAQGTHTEAEWLAILEPCKGICPRCGKRRKLGKDHIKPISRGGSDAIENIQPLCRSCNSSKFESVDYRQADTLSLLAARREAIRFVRQYSCRGLACELSVSRTTICNWGKGKLPQERVPKVLAHQAAVTRWKTDNATAGPSKDSVPSE